MCRILKCIVSDVKGGSSHILGVFSPADRLMLDERGGVFCSVGTLTSIFGEVEHGHVSNVTIPSNAAETPSGPKAVETIILEVGAYKRAA